MRSGSVIIGDLSDGHLMCGRRTVDLAYRHLAEGAHQAALPFGWQRLPDRTGQPIAHRVIQASAPRRTALEYRVSAVRRFVSNYQRRLLWDIESCFRRMKQTGLQVRPMFHWTARRIEAHVKLCVLALQIQRAAELRCQLPWAQIAHALGGLKAVRYRCESRAIVQRTKISAELSVMLKTLKISVPKQVISVEEPPSEAAAA
jgi:hypothetical protein